MELVPIAACEVSDLHSHTGLDTLPNRVKAIKQADVTQILNFVGCFKRLR